MNKQYLGDSVYIEHIECDRAFRLTTDNGRGPNNIIYLEPEIAIAMLAYIQKAFELADTKKGRTS